MRKGSPSDGLSDDQREAAAHHLEGQYMRLWVTPVISALCKHDDNIRRMLAKHVCPNLFRTFPHIVTEILKSLTRHLPYQQPLPSSSMGRKRSLSISEQVLEASRQHALIIVLKVARSLDLITIGQLARVDSEQEQQPTGEVKLAEGTRAPLMAMLNQAVYHPDWSVRADMLGLLCEARRLSTPLSNVEFDLLFKLLRVSSNATSADFRQQQYSALTMLATRLVSIATHAHRIVTTGRPPVPSQKVRHREKAKREAAVADGLAQGKTEEQVLRELGILSQDEMVAQARATLEGVERAVNQWVDLAVRGCLYPGAGFAKVAMGLKWLDILTRFFTPGRPAQAPDDSMLTIANAGSNVTANEVIPVLTHVLLDDPFDTNRSSAFALLTEWPLVAAGSASAEKAAKSWADSLLRRALRLVNNTRAGESESGALIIRWLFRKCQDAAAKNLLDAAQNYPLHGLLTAAHYVAEEVDFESRAVQQNAHLWKQWLADLSGSAIEISNIVLGVLTSASPEGNIPSSFREMETKIDEIIKSSTAIVDADAQVRYWWDDDEVLVGPRQQVILSYCWRAIKEVAGLLAVVATSPPGTDLVHDRVEPLLDESKVGEIGDLLRTLLTSIRHRGAFSGSPPGLSRRVAQWLEQCLDIVTICQVSVTRRSAGWPLCLLAILTCDKNATQALLPRAMDRIFALATDLHVDPEPVNTAVNVDSAGDGTVDLPQVHAINMLRVLLDDKTLAMRMFLSLTGLRSRHWAIRNVCGLLYAALTRRVFGANKAREETIYDGITGRELLKDAVDQMAEADIVEHSAEMLQEAVGDAELPDYDPVGAVMRSGARLIHPALYPCLILLARLQPSPKELEKPDDNTPEPFTVAAASVPLNVPAATGHQRQPSQAEIAASVGVLATSPHSESASAAVAPPMNLDQEPMTKVNERNSTVHVTSASTMLTMYSFTELVEMCVDSPVFKTREMAARAFAPLIPGDKAVSVVLALLKSIRQNGNAILTNSCHGVLCQVQELLRVHWRQGNSTDSMRRAFVMQVFPALTSLWPQLIQGADDGCYAQSADDVSDMVRFKYLCIINEYVARGEDWLLAGVDDLSLIKTTKLVLSRFRISILYGFLHPLFSNPDTLVAIGGAQIPGAFGTLQELTSLLLACIDDTTAAVLQDDGTVQLEVDTSPYAAEGRQVSYNPWVVFENILTNNEFYEAKIVLLDWLIAHISTGQIEIFERIGILNLLSFLRASELPGTIQPALDPLVRSKSILLLALNARFCPLSVATSFVQYQGALLHLLQQCAAVVHKRSIEWAAYLLKWTDPERAVPYREAVSRAVIRYSMIKRFYTGPDGEVDIPFNPTSEEILRMCFWRLLQDDDEDIREFMAKHISRRLGKELACDQACEQIIDRFTPLGNQYPHMLVSHCFEHLLRSSSGKVVVQTAVSPNRRLFEHENPNIYIDEFRNLQLAYRALINLAAMFEDSPTACKEFMDRGMLCEEALSLAHAALLDAKHQISDNGVEISGTLGATSLPVLFSHIQSWILGARVAVFAASRMTGHGGAESLHKIVSCIEGILASAEIQPLHPWVLRSLTAEPVSKDMAMADLYLLTCVE
ncbi:hypothetical protein DL89DRAFT_268164 [Linderina pennispora]|uniref:Uncharacterized protein n=1 Tax=Linderina pennispora TaxID=61395 RepID=A0A1Y1W714_9FUNG|nr:uncharacterized protein DL89DRAFT_268164 [Linderina pennispora]ORX69155.1 hypothetical protein DL89DRAFT_268164 [Linderina pennispora]